MRGVRLVSMILSAVLLGGIVSSLRLPALAVSPQPITFDAPRDYIASSYTLAVGDFNKDGKRDVVAGGATVSLMLGKGDGTFQDPVQIAAGSGLAIALVTGDFNHDTNLDLAIAIDSSPAGSVMVLLGNGNGTFQQPVSYTVGDSPVGIAAVDFNGDHNADLATANIRSGDVSLLRGNADGTFQPALSLALAGIHPRAIAAGNFNGDRFGDLVVADYRNQPGAVLLGNASSTLNVVPGPALSPFINVVALAVGDLNQDQKQDVVLLQQGRNGFFDLSSYSVLLGLGDGTFNKQADQVAPMLPTGLALADMNGDGRADLVMVGRSLQISLGNGDGTFSQGNIYNDTGAFSVRAADLNQDSKPDLIMGLGSPPLVKIRLGNGDGTLRGAPLIIGNLPDTDPDVFAGVATGDFNRDGKQDFATARGSQNSVTKLLVSIGNGDGTFHPPVEYDMGFQSGRINLNVADMNLDGIPDIVATDNGPSHRISVFLGNGDGTFQAAKISFSAFQPDYTVIADFDGDSIPDLALSIMVLTGQDQRGIEILSGLGDGTFKSQVVRTNGIYEPYVLAVGDFNGDHKADLAVVNTSSPSNPPVTTSVTILLGNGDGTFQPSYYVPLQNSWQVFSLATGHFNADARTDLVIFVTHGIAPQNAGLITLFGNGDGTFQFSAFYAVPTLYPTDIGLPLVADFDGDHQDDIVVAGTNSGTSIMVFKGNNDGTFTPGEVFDTTAASNFYAAADFTGDSKPDLIGGHRSIYFLKNTTP